MTVDSVILTSSHRGVFDGVPHYQGVAPIMLIAAAVINAGFDGVRVIEFQLINGRYVQLLEVQESKPAGRYLAKLAAGEKRGKTLPKIHEVLATLARRSKC